LLRGGAAVDEKNALGMTALMLAAGAGHVDVVKALLAAGADPNASVGIAHVGAWSVLTMAMNPLNRNWLEVIDTLIAAGGKVNPPSSVAISPLAYAVEQCDTGMIKALLARGADVNWGNEISHMPLVSAVTEGEPDVEVTRLLLEAGADPNKPRLSVGDECVSILAYLDGWLEGSTDKDREEIRRLLERSGARRHRAKSNGMPCHP
jgi:ankyrin repeat protein